MMSMMGDEGSKHGVPWLHSPVQLHGSREYKCTLKSEVLCKYQAGFWRLWYTDDHHYGVPTTIFFTAAIVLFAFGYVVSRFAPRRLRQSSAYRRPLAVVRYLSYRAFHVPALHWNSPPVGVIALGCIGVVFFFSMMLGPKPYYWPAIKGGSLGGSPPIATRCGWMAIGCLPFIFAMGAKANLVTAVTGVSHEKLQVFHRWIAYAMFVLALTHTFPYIVYHMKIGDMETQWKTSVYYWTGIPAIIGQAWLTFASFAWFRNKCYEFFKLAHFFAVVVFFVFLFIHVDFELTAWDYFIASASIYAASFFYAQIRTYFEHGFGRHATSTMASNGFVRVTVPAKSGWTIGQHIFVRFLGLGPHAWTSHPFTICSLPARAGDEHNELVLYIRPRSGFTGQLGRHVKEQGEVRMRVLLDGPYGGIDMKKFDTLERIFVVAGGSGAGWTLPLVEAFLRRCEMLQITEAAGKEGGAQLPSMRVVIATRDLATRCWYKVTLADIIGAYPSVSSRLEIEMHRTSNEARLPSTSISANGSIIGAKDVEKGEFTHVAVNRAPSNVSAGSSTTELAGVSMHDFDSRPDLPAMIAAEASSEQAQSVGIYLCGPHSMQHDVAKAAAAAQLPIVGDGSRETYLHMEHFAWA